jgi:hypothetical protein
MTGLQEVTIIMGSGLDRNKKYERITLLNILIELVKSGFVTYRCYDWKGLEVRKTYNLCLQY